MIARFGPFPSCGFILELQNAALPKATNTGLLSVGQWFDNWRNISAWHRPYHWWDMMTWPSNGTHTRTLSSSFCSFCSFCSRSRASNSLTLFWSFSNLTSQGVKYVKCFFDVSKNWESTKWFHSFQWDTDPHTFEWNIVGEYTPPIKWLCDYTKLLNYLWPHLDQAYHEMLLVPAICLELFLPYPDSWHAVGTSMNS